MDLSYRTAIKRKGISTPIRYLIDKQLIKRNHKILDFGCGRGQDCDLSVSSGFDAYKYDPYWLPDDKILNKKYDRVLCIYVLNVVNKETREKIITQLKNLVKKKGKIYIAVRRDIKKHKKTSIGTHQYSVRLPYKKITENSGFCIYETQKYL